MRQRKEIQEMSRRRCLIFALLLLATTVSGQNDEALWKEYGLVRADPGQIGKVSYTAYRMKDLTGALAAWEWQRSPAGKPCDLAAFCTRDGNRTVILSDNYLLVFNSAAPRKSDVDSVLRALPNRKDTSLPAILTFLPNDGLVPDSARYVLGPASLAAFAPELASSKPGFEQGAEAQIAQYRLPGSTKDVRLALFYYATPEMARLHTVDFKLLPNTHVKRSGMLVAVVYGGAANREADTLLSRVQYEAKITWNDSPGPSPIKPLYQLLLNILYMTIVLSALCLVAGLIYGGMRIYRRRYGQLEAGEAMTTLHLTGD